jgi:pectate lyase
MLKLTMMALNSKINWFGILIILSISTQCCISNKQNKTEHDIFTNTKGGGGGKIIPVTNLQSSGAGSFREAVSTAGPRIIVFEVGGVIDLDKEHITIDEPFLTIAGQTAPSPGITFIRGSIIIYAHDVIIRHIMIRPGDAGQPKKKGWEPDGMTTVGGKAYNVLIDHCSATWSVDENISVSGPVPNTWENTSHRVIISNCLIAEGLSHSTHSSGEHSKGSLIHDNCRDITVIRNLYADNNQRNPYYKTAATGIIANNLVYNPGIHAIRTHWVEDEWEGAQEPPVAKISIIGNVLIPGKDTRARAFIIADHAELYIRDNVIRDNKTDIPMTTGTFEELDAPPVWHDDLEIMDPDKVMEYVLSHAGARPAHRDPIDQRIINSVTDKTGKIIDSQEEAGGYPVYDSVYRELKIPEDHVQEWLAQMAREVE